MAQKMDQERFSYPDSYQNESYRNRVEQYLEKRVYELIVAMHALKLECWWTLEPDEPRIPLPKPPQRVGLFGLRIILYQDPEDPEYAVRFRYPNGLEQEIRYSGQHPPDSNYSRLEAKQLAYVAGYHPRLVVMVANELEQMKKWFYERVRGVRRHRAGSGAEKAGGASR